MSETATKTPTWRDDPEKVAAAAAKRAATIDAKRAGKDTPAKAAQAASAPAGGRQRAAKVVPPDGSQPAPAPETPPFIAGLLDGSDEALVAAHAAVADAEATLVEVTTAAETIVRKAEHDRDRLIAMRVALGATGRQTG